MVMVGVEPAVPMAATTGYGNSPPARKCADSPLRTIKLGSARICNTFLVWRSAMVAPKLISGRYKKIFKRFDRLKCGGVLGGVVLPAAAEGVRARGPNCWVLTVPIVLVAPVLN